MFLVKKNNSSGLYSKSFDGLNSFNLVPIKQVTKDRSVSLYKLLVYLNTAVIFIFLIGIGFLAYRQFIKNAPLNLAFFPGSSSASRALNFQGRITDDTGEPITGSINMRFKIYDALSGGSQLWYSGAGGCTLTADSDGIFSVGLGDDCGGDITSAVYNSSSSGLWLEIDVYDDGDTVWETLTPRQPIRTVMFAFNAETLQGYYPSTSATVDQIPVIDSSGNLVLSSSSPTFQSTSGDFTIEGNTSLTLTTAIGSNGNISLSPDGLGEIILGANVGIGTTNPSLGLDVGGGTYSISDANDVGISGDLQVLGTTYGNILDFTSGSIDNLTVQNFSTTTLSADYLSVTSASIDYLSISTLSADQITTNFDEGSVIFTDASGNLDSDTSQFFWDDSGNRLGIGTDSPDEKLHLAGGTLLVDTPSPTLEGSYATSGNARDVYVSGKYAYVSIDSPALNIIDVSNPAAPTLTGSLTTGGDVYDLYVAGKYVYLANGSPGLRIIDISNPSSPSLVSTYNPAGWVIGVYVSGKYAYLGTENSGLHIIDISNPASPVLVGSYDTAGTASNIYISGKYAFLTDQSGGFYIIDISNPTSPSLVSRYAPGGFISGVYVSGKYAYIAVDSTGLRILDISNPASPSVVSTYDPGVAQDLYISGKYVYIAGHTGGLHIIDVSNPASPTLAATYNTPGTADAVYISGKYAYVADRGAGLQIIDIGGTDIHAANIGNISTNDLTVWENIDIGNNAYIRNGLNVGPGGLYVDAGEVAFDGNSSATAFRFGQRGTGDILNVFDGSTEIFTILDGGNVGIGTTAPSTFKLEINGSAGPASSPTITSVNQTQTNLHTTTNSGYYPSIAIGTDGLPIISYNYDFNNNLSVAHCTNRACTAATLTRIDVVENLLTSSIAIGSDGLPIISYVEDMYGNLKIAKCTDTACTATIITTLDASGFVGAGSSITIGKDSLPIISYYDYFNGNLKVAQCNNINCSTATITTLDAADDVGGYPSITIGTDGLPIIAYYDLTNGNLKVAKCSNKDCTAALITALDSTGDVGYRPSIAIGTDGLPIIAYTDNTNSALKIAKCTNSICTAATITTLDEDGFTNIGNFITIGTDGLPIISYFNITNSDLKIAKCANSSCTVATITAVDTTVNVDASSIAIGVDGLPIISYQDTTNNYLKVAHCANESCSETTGSYYAGGSDLGSRAKYFNNTYAVNYLAKEGMAISNFDLAEDYLILGEADFGDLVTVALSGNKAVTRSTKAYQDTLLGIVSTKPGIRLSEWDNPKQNQKPIALAGRVPVKVTSINGHITAGDHLTSSPLPGIAMLASKAGMTVGTALEDTNFDKEACTSVFKLADISWPDDDGTNTDKPCFKVPVASLDSKIKNELISDYGLNESDFFYIGKIMTFVNISHFEPEIVKLKLDSLLSKISFNENGFLKIDKFLANDITTNTLSATTINSSTVSADNVMADNLETNKLAASSATIYGPLTTDLLSANSITVNSLSADGVSTDSLLASSAVLGEATISGTLYADHIHGLQDKILDSLQDSSLLSSASHGPSMADIKNELSQEGLTLASNLQTTLDELELSKDDIVLSPSAIYLDKYLEVNGNAYISRSLGIADNLQIGTGLIINSDGLTKQGIYSITADKIQLNPTASGSLSLMADTLVIDQKGEVTINGNTLVKGNIKIEEDVYISGNAILNNKLELTNNSSTSSGNLDNSTGQSMIKAGETRTTIYSSLIEQNSLVYITPASDTNNQVLFIKEQMAEDPATSETKGYFTIEIKEASSTDIYFNWWIIN